MASSSLGRHTRRRQPPALLRALPAPRTRPQEQRGSLPSGLPPVPSRPVPAALRFPRHGDGDREPSIRPQAAGLKQEPPGLSPSPPRLGPVPSRRSHGEKTRGGSATKKRRDPSRSRPDRDPPGPGLRPGLGGSEAAPPGRCPAAGEQKSPAESSRRPPYGKTNEKRAGGCGSEACGQRGARPRRGVLFRAAVAQPGLSPPGSPLPRSEAPRSRPGAPPCRAGIFRRRRFDASPAGASRGRAALQPARGGRNRSRGPAAARGKNSRRRPRAGGDLRGVPVPATAPDPPPPLPLGRPVGAGTW